MLYIDMLVALLKVVHTCNVHSKAIENYKQSVGIVIV